MCSTQGHHTLRISKSSTIEAHFTILWYLREYNASSLVVKYDHHNFDVVAHDLCTGWGGGWTGQTSKGWGGGGVGNRARGRENTAAWSWGGREERKQSVGREGKVTNRGGAGQKKGERVRGGFKRGQHDGKRV
eukprot:614071-Rhodomonas_salina.2